MVNFC